MARVTMERMRELYPNEYVILTDCVDDGTDILEGIVLAHSPHLDEINKVSGSFEGNIVVWYTGELLPAGSYIL